MIASISAFLLLAVTAAPANGVTPLRQAQVIPLPGVAGRIDHLAIDLTGRRLFLAALGNGSLEVVDLRQGKRVRSVPGLREPQGIAYLPDGGKVIVANAGGTVAAFDDRQFQPAGVASDLDDADNVRVDPRTGAAFVGYGDGGLAMLHPLTLKRLGVIALPAHPESFQLETNGPRAYVNVPGAHVIVVVDRGKRAVTSKIALPRWRGNFAMALDEAGHRLFVATRNPARLVVIDTVSLRPVADVACVADADDLFLDAAQARLYVIGGEGFVDQFDARPDGHYQRQARIPTAPGARTGLWAPELRRLFVAVPRRGGRDAAVHVFEAP